MNTFGLGQTNSGIIRMQALALTVCVLALPRVRGWEDEQ